MPTVSAVVDPITDEPMYWFARLDRAIRDGDFAAATEAQRELERLGVRVQYGRPARRKQVPA
jgi:hypothetical protein